MPEIEITYKEVKGAYLKAMRYDNNSLAILHSKFDSFEQLSDLFHTAVADGKEAPFLYLCRVLNVTVNRLEMSIMLSGSQHFEGKIPLFVKLGVSLNLVGEKLAFNANVDVIKQLHTLRFKFETCIDDLLFHFRENKDVTAAILNGLSFTPEKHDYKDELLNLKKLKRVLLVCDNKDVIELLDCESINWSIYRGKMFSKRYFHPYMHPELDNGAKIVTKSLTKYILRGVNDEIQDLIKYLNMVLRGVDSIILTDSVKLKYKSGIKVKISLKSEESTGVSICSLLMDTP
jgi:hypothetical protein